MENLFAVKNSRGNFLEQYRTIYGEVGELLGDCAKVRSLRAFLLYRFFRFKLHSWFYLKLESNLAIFFGEN